MAKTRKQKGSRKVSVKARPLQVDTLSKIPALEKLLKSGKITIVLVYADWCPACHKFRKNVWSPMCKKGAIHNRAAVRDDMVSKSPTLNNAKFNYLPSILVVDENGRMNVAKGPDGKMSNAMRTPRTANEMVQMVNVPVAEAPAPSSGLLPLTQPTVNTANRKLATPDLELESLTPQGPSNLPEQTSGLGEATPQGLTYTPTPQTVAPLTPLGTTPKKNNPPMVQSGGGSLLHTLKSLGSGRLSLQRLLQTRRNKRR